MTDSNSLKRAAGDAAAAYVEDGMVVGLGTGSTAKFAVDAIGKRVAAGLRIVGIPTSERTAEQARSLGIPLATLGDYTEVDITIDGADEVELGTLHLIKGHGGALLREKIVASASKRLIIVADESKLVEKLGGNFPIPLEVAPFGWQATALHLAPLNANPALRFKEDGQPYVTDGGHYILDCAFGIIQDPVDVARKLDSIVGLVDHGLFLGMATEVLVGGSDGVRTVRRS
ncbi:MAG: ribose-5-phosphate isomerase RpiA [Bryobacteraceae bacterium]